MAEIDTSLTDFDPLTEEGQEDINDDELDPLLPERGEDDSTWWSRAGENIMRQPERARDWIKGKLSKKPAAYAQLIQNEEIEMQLLSIHTVEGALPYLRETYSYLNEDFIKLTEKNGEVYISCQNQRQGAEWTTYQKLFTQAGEIQKNVVNLLGWKMAIMPINELVISHDESIEEYQEENVNLKRELQELKNTDGRNITEIALLKIGAYNRLDKIKHNETAIGRLGAENKTLLTEKRMMEGQIRQRDQAIADLEQLVEEQQHILRDGTEEEKEAAQVEIERLKDEIEDLTNQKTAIEEKLGLTTKEKIKRILKIVLPLSIASGIAIAIGEIISMLKGAGGGIAKVGQGLTELGKKMAASIPGLLGSVLSLVLKTGGELLKFVGNNIWILVVAIGMVVVKKLK